ncbi:MAG: LAGLIDADG family homing endonuclease, partial [Caldilineaceae bacterium]
MSPSAAPPTPPATRLEKKTFTTLEVVKGEKTRVTPPSYVDDETINLSDNSLKVLERRYLRRDIDGSLLESAAGMFYRVAHHIAGAEAAHGGDVEATTETFYRLLTDLRFFPNSPTFTGAGTPLGQLAACFVLPIADDMGRDSDGIFSTLRVAALIQQTGGGNGFSFTRLRPRGDVVHTSSGRATGPVGFLRVYDQAFGEIAQGGTRRGANMAVLQVDHPDIEQFITCKAEEGTVTNFNISVAITDEFMRAVKNDSDFDLRSPRDGKVWKTVRARELFDKIIHYAHHNGEPGALFIDAANRTNPVPHLYDLEATNPCVTGETLIYTAEGLQRADALARSGQPQKVVVDGRFGVETVQPASEVFETGVKDVYRLETKEGYSLRLTGNHQVMTARGWVETQHLQPGDRVHILNRSGAFGTAGTRDLGLVLGWLVGDGTVNQIRAVLSFFGEEKTELAPLFASAVTAVVDTDRHYSAGHSRSYPVGITEILERDEVRIQSDRLRLLAEEYGLDLNKLQVPDVILRGTQEAQQAFLQALFTADGTVSDGGKKGCAVRLTSVSEALLQDVQRVLLNFGVFSRIYRERRPAGMRRLPDGKGGYQEYFCQAYHELAVSKDNLIRFAEQVGFLSQAKQSVLLAYLERMQRGPYQESFTARVKRLVHEGREMVYDLTQPTTHSFVANGFVVHNCGEQWLGPYENCCLGSINLGVHVKADADGETVVDWVGLERTIRESTHFLDNVVSANAYVPAVPEVAEAAFRARRIGLGIMGLGDLMYKLGIRYGSEEGQEFAGQVMEFVRYHCMAQSIELSEERGAFLAFTGSIYDPEKAGGMAWQPPTPVAPFQRDWARPALDWSSIVSGIEQHGIRNAAQTTVAPTGTIATVSGCEGYGCEPVFALGYIRHFKDGDKDVELAYTSPLFEQALERTDLSPAHKQRIKQHVASYGSCQDVEDMPAELRHAFVVSSDISADEHVRMQAAIQAFVDNSISKTCNFGEGATEEDVAKAYLLAWELGCKGLTVYVTGSRQEVVLETKATKEKKSEGETVAESSLNGYANGSNGHHPGEVVPIFTKRPRPRLLQGSTYRKDTPLGPAYITVNSDEEGEPFEVFLNIGKAGSDVSAVSEALGRLISLTLRMPASLPPSERLRWVMDEMAGIGGGRALGFGANRVRSLPDGV